MSLVIDADGHVEETLPELVDAIPSAMRDSAMQFVAESGGYVTYRIEGRLWRSKYPIPSCVCRCSMTRGSTPPCCIRAWG